MKQAYCDILFGSSSPFQDASEEIKSLLIEHGRISKKKKGMIINAEGDDVDYVYLILSGQAQISRTDVNGRSVLIHPGATGSWVGFVGYYFNKKWPYDLVSSLNCELFCLPVKALEQVCDINPHIYRKILELMAYYSCFFGDHLMAFVCKPLCLRIAEALLSFSERYQSLEVKLTQNDLAAFLGVTREATAQQLSQLQKSGYISSGYGKIVINNKDSLKQYCRDNANARTEDQFSSPLVSIL